MPYFFRFLLVLIFPCSFLQAQQTAAFSGVVTDTTGKALAFVNIVVPSLNKGTASNESGKFILQLPAGNYEVHFSLMGYHTEKIQVRLMPEQKTELHITLKLNVHKLEEVSVFGRNQDMNRIPVKEFEAIPNPSGSLEALIKTLPGVSSANELSSQYSVRGGSFDENLVYVNDIEIIRPFLIRSGQQEGLSFINPDLVGSIRFSAGGFDARYGDKMSSVLDVTYRSPVKSAASFNASLMGGAVSAEGISPGGKLSVITGYRYKTTRLLLGSLDSKGEYEPDFSDWQMMLNYKAGDKFTFGLLTNYARNSYRFYPQTRNTSFGTFANVYNLKVYYNGRESDAYNSVMGAVTAQYRINENLRMKLLYNMYSVYEEEQFDISGQYLINELDAYPGSATYGDSILNLGVGAMLNHARNYLNANIRSAGYLGNWTKNGHSVSWSVRYQHDRFSDRMSEWDYIDSAGYASPYSEHNIVLSNSINSRNDITVERYTAYIQDEYSWAGKKASYTVNAGIRFHAWSLTSEKLFSPRFRFIMRPAGNRTSYYIASGIYYQPPFYKEMRDLAGNLNTSVKAQKSVHLLAGAETMLTLWDRPFKYTCEAYYKFLKSIIPYKLDNLRVKYTGINNAVGFATGVDMKLYGEFVPGVESWASISLLSTKEDLTDDFYHDANGNRVEPGFYHRPTDQRFHINLFFQDYLPNYPSFKVSLNLVYGSGFYVAPPRTSRFDQTYPLGHYRRIDLGLSKTFRMSFLPQLKSFWIGAEVFNMFDIRNKASFMWIQTVSNQENVPNLFAVPNYLTSRRINIKMSVKF